MTLNKRDKAFALTESTLQRVREELNIHSKVQGGKNTDLLNVRNQGSPISDI